MLQAMDAFERALHHHQRRSYREVTAPYQRKRLQRLQCIVGAVLGTVDVRIEKSSTGVLTLRGATLDPPTVMEAMLLSICVVRSAWDRGSGRQCGISATVVGKAWLA